MNDPYGKNTHHVFVGGGYVHELDQPEGNEKSAISFP